MLPYLPSSTSPRREIVAARDAHEGDGELNVPSQAIGKLSQAVNHKEKSMTRSPRRFLLGWARTGSRDWVWLLDPEVWVVGLAIPAACRKNMQLERGYGAARETISALLGGKLQLFNVQHAVQCSAVERSLRGVLQSPSPLTR